MPIGTRSPRTVLTSVRAKAARVAVRVFGPGLPGHYVPALRARGRGVPYDAATRWTRRYERVLGEGRIDDASTIKRGANPLRARYHYNAVENAILEHALRRPFPEQPTVLDVGSGAGHWIDFYRETFGGAHVVAVEIAAPAARALEETYAQAPEVEVVVGDVADATFDLGRRFDVVSAVDVLFHIVEDAAWVRAVERLAAHLADGGRILAAEHVALVTHDAGFARAAEEGDDASTQARALVTKRVRSARAWRVCARRAGLAVVDSIPVRKSRMAATPANRLLVLAPRAERRRFLRHG